MAVGIVCEYNPFHNGHLYQIEEIKRITGEEIVCVMSGEVVQRGEIASAEKTTRAVWAIDGGASVVLENPYPFSCAAAERFAASAVTVLAESGLCDTVSFGAEDAEEDLFWRTASLLLEKSTADAITSRIRADKTLGYAQARGLVLEEKCGTETVRFLEKPNNLLGVEYAKAILKYRYPLKLLPVARRGAGHDGASAGGFSSSGYLRSHPEETLWSGSCPAFVGMPAVRRFNGDKLYGALCQRLLTGDPDELVHIAELPAGFAHRLIRAAKETGSLAELIEAIGVKHLTDAHIRRMLLYLLAGTEKAELQTLPRYTNLLACSSAGARLLKEASKSGKQTIALFSKISDSKKAPPEVRGDFDRAMCAERLFMKLA